MFIYRKKGADNEGADREVIQSEQIAYFTPEDYGDFYRIKFQLVTDSINWDFNSIEERDRHLSIIKGLLSATSISLEDYPLQKLLEE